MDVRVRWSRMAKPASTTMLELLVCLCVIGAMIWVAARGMQRVQQRLYVMEAVSLMAGPKIAMMEYRAVNGIWPSSNERVPNRGDLQVSRLSMSRVPPSLAAASATNGSPVDGSRRSLRRRIAT